jgi:hypothetical protein
MSLLDKASLIITPNAVKASKLYSIIPSNGNGDMDVVRATTATRVNSAGIIESVASNVPRLNYDVAGGCPSILVEPQRTNRLLNSDVVVTQSITTAGLQMAVSFYGTGTITFSGTFVGSLVGTGANNRVSTVFTPTTGTLVLTVTGSVTKGQVETGGYATSYIPTLGTSVTRNQDAISKTGISDLIGQTQGVVFIESSALFNDLTQRGISISDSTNLNRITIFYHSTSNNILVTNLSNNVTIFQLSYTITDTTQFAKIAIRYSNTLGASLWVNGVSRASTVNTTLPASFNRLGFDTVADRPFFGKLKQVHLYKSYLTDTEMSNLTTL